MPTNFPALCAAVEKIEGVHFRDLVERLVAGRVTGDELLQKIFAEVAPYGRFQSIWSGPRIPVRRPLGSHTRCGAKS